MSVINILMQLRKVCNHPDLFDPRPTVSPFSMQGIVFTTASPVLRALDRDPLKVVSAVRCCLCILLYVFLLSSLPTVIDRLIGHTAELRLTLVVDESSLTSC